jgi:hypothetical protein
MFAEPISFPILRNPVFSAAILPAPTVAFAQDTFGASINGEERGWYLTPQDGESRRFGLRIAMANLQSFSLWSQPTGNTVETLKETLLLRFDVMSAGDRMIPLNASLI